MKKTIALDFDAVLHRYIGWRGGAMDGALEGAKAAVERFIADGFEVKIYSTRDHKVITRWLDQYGFPPIEVSAEKPLCFVIVDDRAVRFEGKWTPELIREIENFKAYWEDGYAAFRDSL